MLEAAFQPGPSLWGKSSSKKEATRSSLSQLHQHRRHLSWVTHQPPDRAPCVGTDLMYLSLNRSVWLITIRCMHHGHTWLPPKKLTMSTSSTRLTRWEESTCRSFPPMILIWQEHSLSGRSLMYFSECSWLWWLRWRWCGLPVGLCLITLSFPSRLFLFPSSCYDGRTHKHVCTKQGRQSSADSIKVGAGDFSAYYPEEAYCSALDINCQDGEPRFPWQRDVAIQCDLGPTIRVSASEPSSTGASSPMFLSAKEEQKKLSLPAHPATSHLLPTPKETVHKKLSHPFSGLRFWKSTSPLPIEENKPLAAPSLSNIVSATTSSTALPTISSPVTVFKKHHKSVLQRAVSFDSRGYSKLVQGDSVASLDSPSAILREDEKNEPSFLFVPPYFNPHYTSPEIVSPAVRSDGGGYSSAYHHASSDHRKRSDPSQDVISAPESRFQSPPRSNIQSPFVSTYVSAVYFLLEKRSQIIISWIRINMMREHVLLPLFSPNSIHWDWKIQYFETNVLPFLPLLYFDQFVFASCFPFPMQFDLYVSPTVWILSPSSSADVVHASSLHDWKKPFVISQSRPGFPSPFSVCEKI